jgi:hypothetical protein
MEMPAPPSQGNPLTTLALASAQHGDAVHGAVQIPAADVGRLVRSSTPAGKVSFTVSLDAVARRALQQHHKLALTVKIMLKPRQGTSVTITRSVVVHA